MFSLSSAAATKAEGYWMAEKAALPMVAAAADLWQKVSEKDIPIQ